MIDAAAALQHLTGEPALATLAPAHRYHPRVFLAPPWPEIYVIDTEGRHGLSAATAEYQRLLDVYPSLGYQVTILPKTSAPERAGAAPQLSRAARSAGAGADQQDPPHWPAAGALDAGERVPTLPGRTTTTLPKLRRDGVPGANPLDRRLMALERTSTIAGTDVRIFGSDREAIADADNRPAGGDVEVIRIVTGVQRAPEHLR